MSQRIEMPWGFVEFNDTNEVLIVSTVPDPPKLRLGAAEGGSLGAISFDRIRPDGRSVEVALLQGKQDERTRSMGPPQSYACEMTLHLNAGGEDDRDMRHVLTIRPDGIRFLVPVTTASGITA